MNIADQAKTEIIKRITPAKPFLRIFITGGGCSGFSYNFELDNIQINDQIIDNLIVIDSESWVFLQSAQLNYVDDLTGQYFKLDIPEAKSFCGCGTSFSI